MQNCFSKELFALLKGEIGLWRFLTSINLFCPIICSKYYILGLKESSSDIAVS